MYLKKVDIKEFKKVIYLAYKSIFPESERKDYADIKKSYNNNITDIIEIIVEEQFVGFFIIDFLKDSPYVLLDFFAILPKYQNKGYGSEAIKLLKEMYKDYDGIFIEIEKIGNGDNEKENQIRQRRAKFYENLGFHKLGFDIELYSVLFSAYMLPCAKNIFADEKVIKNILEIYNAILGEKKIKKNCKIIIGQEIKWKIC
ncbi:MAG: GNAT family N-acetyltransferase [Clostridia bacterium]